MLDDDKTGQLERATVRIALLSPEAFNELPDAARSAIVELEAVISRLPAPVSCWARINEGVDGFGYWCEDVGFASIKSVWRLAIRTTDGHEDSPKYENQELWAFDEVPRTLRFRAADKIQVLVAKLQTELSASGNAVHGSAGTPSA